MLGMITTAAHKRIVAEKDAEIAGLMKRMQTMRQNMVMDDEYITRLLQRLAPFTTPRPRNAKGQFMKDPA